MLACWPSKVRGVAPPEALPVHHSSGMSKDLCSGGQSDFGVVWCPTGGKQCTGHEHDQKCQQTIQQ